MSRRLGVQRPGSPRLEQVLQAGLARGGAGRRFPQPASTAGWEHRSGFKVALQKGKSGNLPLSADIVSMLAAQPSPPGPDDVLLVMTLLEVSDRESRVELASVLRAYIQAALDDMQEGAFSGITFADMQSECRPWTSTHTYAWFTNSPKAAGAAAALPGVDAIMEKALEKMGGAAAASIVTSTGKDVYIAKNPSPAAWEFARQNKRP
jgi:hypothetical protein